MPRGRDAPIYMEITVNMPSLTPEREESRLLAFGKRENEGVSVGDVLFAYEADGALMYEYSPFKGRVVVCAARSGDMLKGGAPVITVSVSEDGAFSSYGTDGGQAETAVKEGPPQGR